MVTREEEEEEDSCRIDLEQYPDFRIRSLFSVKRVNNGFTREFLEEAATQGNLFRERLAYTLFFVVQDTLEGGGRGGGAHCAKMRRRGGGTLFSFSTCSEIY